MVSALLILVKRILDMKSFCIKLLLLLTLLLLVSACKATEPPLKPNPSATGVAATAIPPDHVGRTTCFVCHQTGIGGAPKFPAGHEASADNITFCQKCHQAPATKNALGSVPTSTTQPLTTQPPALAVTPPPSTSLSTTVPTTNTTPTAGVAGPPKIPHAIDAAHTDCLLCHQTGVSGAIKIPGDHTGRTDAMCTLSGCHASS